MSNCSTVLREQNRVVGKAHDLPLAENFLDRIFYRAARFRVHDVEDHIHGFRASFLQVPSCELLGDRIQKGHSAVHVRGDHRVTNAGKSGRKPLFTLCQCFLRLFTFGQLALQ